MKCSKCQTENKNDSKFCLSCGESLAVVTPIDDGIRKSPSSNKRYSQGKDPTLAAILSLILPGLALGQFYNGDTLKGVVTLVGALILSFTIIGFLCVWAWSIVDAYQVAKGNKSLWK